MSVSHAGGIRRSSLNTSELAFLLERQQLEVHFQPLLSLQSQGLHGFEALVRGPPSSPLRSPASLFDAARQEGRLLELDDLCRERAIERFAALDLPGQLFLNISPDALLDAQSRPELTHALAVRNGIGPGRVVIEVSEQSPMEELEPIHHAVIRYRQFGAAIALDDLGAGYAGLRQWSELKPHYVKIDRHFIRDLATSSDKRHFVRAIRQVAEVLDCQPVAEGVETRAELEVVADLGVHLVQGFHLAPPAPRPVKDLTLPSDLAWRGGGNPIGPRRWHLTDTVGRLLVEREALSSDMTMDQAIQAFLERSTVTSLPVVDAHDRPLGLVQRQELLARYAWRFGRELYRDRPVTAFIASEPFIVRADIPVEQISQWVTSAKDSTSVQDALIVTDDEGRYLGVATVLDLLQRITTLQVHNARHANPLTGLPGNVPIEAEIDRRLATGDVFAVAYCDLDQFKPYNDRYGYARGDEVIRWLGELLVAQVSRGDDFIGHVGGDDFILLLGGSDAHDRCQAILAQFDSQVAHFYEADDRQKGGIEGEDRQGRPVFHPFLALSIGLIPEAQRFQNHREIATRATDVKAQAKGTRGSMLRVDRRA